MISVRFGSGTGKVVGRLHFAANVEFFRPGLVAGVTGRRAELAAVLRRAGVQALRFPGGGAAYFYLAESKAASLRLAHAIGHWEFRDDRPPNDGFVSLRDLGEFSRDYGVGLIYQLPCLFYWDGERPRAIIRSKFCRRAQWLYDHDRVGQGVAYGLDVVRRLRKCGARVAMWEIGNEEFALTSAEDYARVAAAYLRGLREIDPRTPVGIVGMGGQWAGEVLQRLRELGVADEVDYLDVHYPFGRWPAPPSTEQKDDPRAFAAGDVMFGKWLGAFERMRARAAPRARVAVTETTVMRFQSWEPAAIVPTLGHALCYAWNWMELLEQPEVEVAVFHDLETPFFGMVRYDVVWNERRRKFAWIAGRQLQAGAKAFAGRWVMSPTAVANRLLSALVGQELVEAVTDGGGRVRVIASREIAVAVNRSGEAVVLRLPFSRARATALVGSGPGAALPGEYTVESLRVTNRGGTVAVRLPAWSVVQVRGVRPRR